MKGTSVREFYNLWKQGVQLKIAIRVAETKQKAWNKRYYVLPDEKGKLRALCNADIKWLKKNGHMSQKVSHLDVMRECFYYTKSSLNDSNPISPEEREVKRKEWLKYNK